MKGIMLLRVWMMTAWGTFSHAQGPVVPPADFGAQVAGAQASEARLDAWMAALPAALGSAEDAARWTRGLWIDFGDPATNASAQFGIFVLLANLDSWSPSAPAEARQAVRDALVRYWWEGGHDNLLTAPREVGAQFGRALTKVSGPEDVGAHEVLVTVAVTILRTPETPGITAEGLREIARALGQSPEAVAAELARQHAEFVDGLRRVLADKLPKGLDTALQQELVGRFETLQLELASEAMEAESQHSLEGGVAASSGPDAASDLRRLREELRVLVRTAGDADRVRRVAALARRIDGRAPRGARRLVCTAYARVLRATRTADEVVRAIEHELLNSALPAGAASDRRAWIRAALAVGARASETFVKQLRQRARTADAPDARRCYDQVARRLERRLRSTGKRP